VSNPNPSPSTRFKKGEAPKSPGPPRTKHIRRAAQRLVAGKVPTKLLAIAREEGFRGKTWAELILFGQALDATKGNTAAANFVADRAEGKVKEEIEHSGGAVDTYEMVFEGGVPKLKQ
jgi:hypothetical protein